MSAGYAACPLARSGDLRPYLEFTQTRGHTAQHMPEPHSTPDLLPLNLYRSEDPLRVRVLENRRLTAADSPADVRHIVLGFARGSFRFLEGQAVAVAPPLPDARPRFYSVSSDRLGEDGEGCTLTLTVKRALPPAGAGVALATSAQLCDAQPGDELWLSGPFGKDVLPADPMAPLLCVGTGTGVAPLRSFVRRRLREPGGPVWLFLGARSRDTLLYRDEWMTFAAADPASRVAFALSAEETTASGARLHVQDRLREAGEALWRLVRHPLAHVYVCGVRGSDGSVDDVLAELSQRAGEDWPSVREDLVRSGRWHIAVY